MRAIEELRRMTRETIACPEETEYRSNGTCVHTTSTEQHRLLLHARHYLPALLDVAEAEREIERLRAGERLGTLRIEEHEVKR